MALKRRKLLAQGLSIGVGTDTIPADSGGSLVGDKINLSALYLTYSNAFSATPAFNLANGIQHAITLTSNVTSSTITAGGASIPTGTRAVLRITQDATGSRIFAFPANVLNSSSYLISRTAGATTRLEMQYNGTNWEIVGPPGYISSDDVYFSAPDIRTHGNGATAVAPNATIFGFQAGNATMTGGNNTLVGVNAGENVTSGFSVTAFGYNAARLVTTGASIVALGSQAGASEVDGIGNVFVGPFAGMSMTGAGGCTVIGYHAGHLATSGTNNTVVGVNAGYNNTTGHENSFFGGHAGDGNTTGSQNTAVGYGTLNANQTTPDNVAVGYAAGLALTGGAGQNVFVGVNAGAAQTSGENNTYLGWNAGVTTTTGHDNVCVGVLADTATATKWSIVLGRSAKATADSQFIAGSATAPITHAYFGEGPAGNNTATLHASLWQGQEVSDPTAPSTNSGITYYRDSGGGKTQLVVRFPTGAVQVIATEP